MSRRLSLNHMNNLEKIKSFNENEMVDFLNYIIDEGSHALADDLFEEYGWEDNGSSEHEVKEWLRIDSLDKGGW